MDFAMRVYCKNYHDPKTKNSRFAGRRESGKSICPSWAINPTLQQILLRYALVRDGEAKDAFGQPKRRWNAVEGQVFVGVSCNTQDGAYNCYPEEPPDGELYAELMRRRQRTQAEVMNDTEDCDVDDPV